MGEVKIRSGEAGDVPALTAIYNHYVVSTAITFDIETVSVEARREWFGRYASTGRRRLLVAVDGETVVGYATSGPFRERAAYGPSVELSAYCAPDARGRGVGTRLYEELLDALRAEDVHRVYAGIALPNDASERLHRRFGFRPVGVMSEVGRKFGRYWDVLWMERRMPV